MTQLFALRKGRTEALVNHGSGWIRMDVLVPARGPHRLSHGVPDRDPRHGDPASRLRAASSPGSASSARGRPARSSPTARGKTTSYAILNLPGARLALRRPGVDVYEGMIVGENARPRRPRRERDEGEEADQHARAASADTTVRLIPPRPLSLDLALEYIREDECVEVTPTDIRHAESRAVGAKAADRREPQVARPRARLSRRRRRLRLAARPAGRRERATGTASTRRRRRRPSPLRRARPPERRRSTPPRLLIRTRRARSTR